MHFTNENYNFAIGKKLKISEKIHFVNKWHAISFIFKLLLTRERITCTEPNIFVTKDKQITPQIVHYYSIFISFDAKTYKWRDNSPVSTLWKHNFVQVLVNVKHKNHNTKPLLKERYYWGLNMIFIQSCLLLPRNNMFSQFASGVRVFVSYLVQLAQVQVHYWGLSREEPHRRPCCCHHILSTATERDDVTVNQD